MDADLPHTLEAIKTMRLLATLTDQIEDPRWETKEEYQSFSRNFSVEGINQYFNQCLNLAQTFGKEYKFNQALWFEVFNLVSQFHILRFLLKWLKLSKISLISNVDFQVI